ncbi:MAG TPA: S1 RNA-binding domain-containing protein [Pirellulales bacterium]|nr:S1 RNA-binding domain-containing protein [Pirellulales bacterium]
MTSNSSETAPSSPLSQPDHAPSAEHLAPAPGSVEPAGAFHPPEPPASPAPGPAADPGPPGAARSHGPKIRIGSQRPGSPKVKAKPQVGSVETPPAKKVDVPNIRERLPIEMELEVEEALGDVSLDEMIEPGSAAAPAGELQPESRHRGRVASIHRDNVFIDLGGRNQGVLSLRQFPVAPEVGTMVEVIVTRFDAEEGLYQIALPGAAVDVADWSDLATGMVVEAKVTGHNKGGLECEVNHIRGFIPAGQVSLYRVEDLAQFVGESMTCVVTEANPERRNLVLSRRAVLEREKAEAKTKLMSELAEGQVREGVVRSLQDYGAFIDMGGVDGLLHVSQLSWQRVKHPSEVLQVGQPIKVKIRKIDQETGKISLAFRDLSENPWTTAPQKYFGTSVHEGTVSKIMDFGAFVELEPGVEGLVHISELSHGRVFRVRDIVSEGQKVEVKVLSIDPEQQRISLSMKALQAKPEAKKAEAEPEPEEATPPPPSPKRKGELKGGLGRSTGGDQFGLKW